MKRIFQNINGVLAFFLFSCTLINLFLYILGYSFQPYNYPLFLLLCMGIAVLGTILSLKSPEPLKTAQKRLGMCMPVFTIVYLISLGVTLECSPIFVQFGTFYFEVLFLLFFIPSLLLFFRFCNHKKIRTVIKIFLAILSVPVFLIMAFTLFAGLFVKIQVTEKMVSPDSAYCAWAVSFDQGALGGNVSLYAGNMKRKIPLGIGSWKRRLRLLCNNSWNTSYTLAWKDNHILQVNGREYDLSYILNGSDRSLKKYSKELNIWLPDRTPNFIQDTHGGVHGDGDCIMRYDLTEMETANIEIDIQKNGNWKLIDHQSALYLYGGAEYFLTNGLSAGKIPEISDGYYCFYDKQTHSPEFPNQQPFSWNYILAQYSSKEQRLYIYELDT